MNKKYKIFVLIVCLLYVAYHMVTLSYSPLPWYDEVSFASITNSYIKHHTFYPEAINISVHRQNSMYGPVFFALQAWIIKMFGWTMFNFRISNLLFGFADIYLVYQLCRHFKFKPVAILITVVILALERSYNQFLHSGRMDFMTLFFFLASYLVFVQINVRQAAKIFFPAMLTGTLLACAFLTTPRIIFAFSVYVFYFFYDIYENRRSNLKNILLQYTIIVLIFSALCSVWVFTEFGSIAGYIDANYTNNEVIKAHVGKSTNEFQLNSGLFYCVYALVCFAILLITKKAKENIQLILFTVPAIIFFLLLVGGSLSGRYYAMVAPFTTVLFVGVTINQYDSVFPRAINYGIIGILVCIFVFKGLYVFASLKERDPLSNEQRIMQYIPQHSTIAGDFEFYYFARRKQCYFQSLSENGMPNTVFSYFRNRDYDYFIFNKHSGEIDNYKARVFRDRYKLIATIDDNSQAGWLWTLASKMGYKITENYSCYIYKNISKDQALTTQKTIHKLPLIH